eukprot:8364_1
MFTINIALNDDYIGGGLFVATPNEHWLYIHDRYIPYVPPRDIKTYEYLANIQRKNTSHHMFPILNTGDALIHNYSVYHGIAPIISGTKYSLLFFYEMQHYKDIREKYTKQQPVYQVQEMDALFVNLIDDDSIIDLYWIGVNSYGVEEYHIIEEDMDYNNQKKMNTYSGHVFRAVERQTKQIIGEYVMKADVDLYEIKWHRQHGDHDGATESCESHALESC